MKVVYTLLMIAAEYIVNNNIEYVYNDEQKTITEECHDLIAAITHTNIKTRFYKSKDECVWLKALEYFCLKGNLYYIKYLYEKIKDMLFGDVDYFIRLCIYSNNPDTVRYMYENSTRFYGWFPILDHCSVCPLIESSGALPNFDYIEDKDTRIKEKKKQLEVVKVMFENYKTKFNGTYSELVLYYVSYTLGNPDVFIYILNHIPEFREICTFDYLMMLCYDKEHPTREDIWKVWDSIFTKEEQEELIKKKNQEYEYHKNNCTICK